MPLQPTLLQSGRTWHFLTLVHNLLSSGTEGCGVEVFSDSSEGWSSIAQFRYIVTSSWLRVRLRVRQKFRGSTAYLTDTFLIRGGFNRLSPKAIDVMPRYTDRLIFQIRSHFVKIFATLFTK
jgi:hypothetical protein